MKVTFLNKDTIDLFGDRINKIEADSRRRWGTLSPAGLMRHLTYTFDLSLGKETEKDISNIFTRTVLRYLFFHLFTKWPGGKIKAPDTFTPEPADDFEAERRRAIESMQAFAEALAAEPDRKTLSPLLGPIPLSYWSRVHGLHLNHHFRQFDVPTV